MEQRMLFSHRAGYQRPSLPPSSASKSDISGATPIGRTPAGHASHRLQSPSFASAMEDIGGGGGRGGGGGTGSLLSREGAPAEEQVATLRAALIATMEEVDSLRRESALEQGKLQREFREAVTAITAERSHYGHGSSRHGNTMSAEGASEVASRLQYLESVVQGLQGGAASADGSSFHAHKSNLSTLEQAAAPAAVDAALRRMADFMSHADREINASNDRLDRELAEWHERINAMQHEQQAALEQVRAKHASYEEFIDSQRSRFMSPSRRGGNNNSTTAVANESYANNDGGGGDDGEARVTSSSFVTLTQVSNMINAQVVEVAALMDAELAKVRETASGIRSEHENTVRRIDVIAETLSQVEDESAETRRRAEEQVAAIERSSGSAEANLRKVEGFVEQFTLHESANIRDEVLRLVNSDSAVAQRKIDDRQRRDEAAALKQDVLRSLTSVERLQEEMGRVTTQQNSLYQSFQRSEQSTQSIQHKVDQELKSELQRLEQLQRSFFARQEQQMQTERNATLQKMQDDMRRVQEKQMEELRASEKRRLDDVMTSQQQIRDDFATFVESQRKEQQGAVSKLKEDFAAAARHANEEMQRSLSATNDANKRQHGQAMDEFRRSAARASDELRRLQLQVDDMTKRFDDQSGYLQSRVQQALDEEVLRVERMGNEIVLQLNNVVEDEVKRVVKSHEGTTQRALTQLEERTTREHKTLRDEVVSLRTSLNAVAAPSASIQSVDARVDVLRRDMSELYDAVATARQAEERVVGRSREEARLAVDAARAEIARDVAHQLHRFDAVLVDLSRDQALRSEEVASLAMRVERHGSAVLNGTGGGGGVGGSGGAVNASSYNQPQQQQYQQQQPHYHPASDSPASTSGRGCFDATTSYLQSVPMRSTSARGGAGNAAGPSGLTSTPAQQSSSARPGGTRTALDSLLASPVGGAQQQHQPRFSALAPPQSGASQRSASGGLGMVLPTDPRDTPSPPRPSRADALEGAFDASPY